MLKYFYINKLHIMSDWYKIERMLVGGDQVWPVGYTWQLYKETDFKNWSYWWFRLSWWYTSTVPSNIGFNTSEGYIYSTSTHSDWKMMAVLSDQSLFQSAKAVKIIVDWIWLGNNSSSQYQSWINIADIWFRKNSSSQAPSWFPLQTWVSGEYIIEQWWYSTLTLSNWMVLTWTRSRDILVSSNQYWWFYSQLSDYVVPMWRLYLDQSVGSRMKDIHVYLAF